MLAERTRRKSPFLPSQEKRPGSSAPGSDAAGVRCRLFGWLVLVSSACVRMTVGAHSPSETTAAILIRTTTDGHEASQPQPAAASSPPKSHVHCYQNKSIRSVHLFKGRVSRSTDQTSPLYTAEPVFIWIILFILSSSEFLMISMNLIHFVLFSIYKSDRWTTYFVGVVSGVFYVRFQTSAQRKDCFN